MAWRKGNDGAEQYGEQYPTGNISAEDWAKLQDRAAPVTESRREQLLRIDEENQDRRHLN